MAYAWLVSSRAKSDAMSTDEIWLTDDSLVVVRRGVTLRKVLGVTAAMAVIAGFAMVGDLIVGILGGLVGGAVLWVLVLRNPGRPGETHAAWLEYVGRSSSTEVFLLRDVASARVSTGMSPQLELSLRDGRTSKVPWQRGPKSTALLRAALGQVMTG